jgi:iron(III) transport system ATP-binding protein
VTNPATNGKTALSVDALCHSYGTHNVLDHVSLEVPKGGITAVLGPSGGGKTTLLRAIAGFETPRSGSITIAGDVVVRNGQSLVPAERRGVTVVPQEGALFPHLSVRDNIAFGLRKRRGSEADDRVRHLLEIIDLQQVADARPAELSGGMQQRVALARALAPSPALVLLDEPFSALDASLRQSVRDQVVATLRREGETALWVTHDQQEALSVADRVAVLIDGQLMQVADPVTLYREPATKQIARFVGEAVVLSATVESGGTHATCDAGRVVLARPTTPGPAEVVIRPEQIEIAANSIEPTSPKCDGVVRATRFFGHDGIVDVQLAGGSMVSVRVHATLLPSVGDCVDVKINGPVLAFE